MTLTDPDESFENYLAGELSDRDVMDKQVIDACLMRIARREAQLARFKAHAQALVDQAGHWLEHVSAPLNRAIKADRRTVEQYAEAMYRRDPKKYRGESLPFGKITLRAPSTVGRLTIDEKKAVPALSSRLPSYVEAKPVEYRIPANPIKAQLGKAFGLRVLPDEGDGIDRWEVLTPMGEVIPGMIFEKDQDPKVTVEAGIAHDLPEDLDEVEDDPEPEDESSEDVPRPAGVPVPPH
jgi:hypothetical protein